MIERKLEDIHDDLSSNVTQIYNRNDLLTALDLVYHSVVRFKFRKHWVPRGWVEVLIIGDTREGKSDSIKKIIQHYKAGEFCEGESVSMAGLLGGIQAIGKRNTVTWGKIPLNDRRLVAIDEVSGMTSEQISLFSGIRSSGIAQITKILTEKTYARTRLIWISNPRSGRKLETYNYGILAVKELMGKLEDISRLDFALTVANGEVAAAIMNRGADREVPHRYTSEACADLVQWAWTRGGEDVVFRPAAEEAILDYSEGLGQKYSSQIPLVQPAEQRIKLARLCVSLACRLFSTDDGEHVIVTEDHATYIYNYLNRIYDKPSMAYNEFSKTAMKQSGEKKITAEVEEQYARKADGTTMTDILLSTNVIKKTMLQEMMGWDRETAHDFLSWGVRHGMLISVSSGLVKSPAFVLFLRRLKKDSDGEDEPSLPANEIVDDSPF